ncbi:hypothetical protein F2Q70_00015104 [Brassica cretica]|uniref:Uncharacterized protein n=1 Tax=Brassica cretica TaxID=69181 RepID=A0A8S9HTL4_BRACR|nr:hypothetical protein F2Q70_00015104 [Brassica cretica]KAF2598347.1 hypothetical protein F2Q68_00008175 [Brassica cretica]
MISFLKNVLSKPRVIVGVGVSVGVVGTTFAFAQNWSSRAQKAAKREKANREQAEKVNNKTLAREWNKDFNRRQQENKHGPFVVPDKKKKRTKPANWGQKPKPNEEAEPVKEEKAPQVIPVATKEKAPSVADTVVKKSPAKENTPQVIPVATEEEKAPPVADPVEESPAEENAPVATMEEKVPVVKKEEAEEEAPVATKKKEVEEEAPAVATKEEEAPAATSTSTVT